VKNMDMHEILEIKAAIEDVRGVDKVLWMDDFEDIAVPAEFMTAEVREMFLPGDSALLQVYFNENSRSKSTMQAVKMIRDIIGDGALFGGEPAIMYDMQETTSREMLYYIIIAFTTIFLILSASMTSFIEPLLFMVSVGIAI